MKKNIKSINIIVVFLLLLMMLSPIIAWGVSAQVSQAGYVEVIVDSPSIVDYGTTFDVRVWINANEYFVAGYELELVYNEKLLNAVNVREGAFLVGKEKNKTIFVSMIKGNAITIESAILTPEVEVKGSGVLAIVTFEAVGMEGLVSFDLFNVTVAGCDAKPLGIKLLGSKSQIVYHGTVDEDTDGDGIPNFKDNCPLVSNPRQLDEDRDGLGNECDTCPSDTMNDMDGDGICGDVDNCSGTFNPDQVDTDKDGIGDFCDKVNDDKPRFITDLLSDDSSIRTVLDEAMYRETEKSDKKEDKITFIWGGKRVQVGVSDGSISIIGVTNER